MLTFKYWIEMKEGYKPTSQTETENEMTLMIEAKNRVTADRMVKALIKGNDNVISWDGICISD